MIYVRTNNYKLTKKDIEMLLACVPEKGTIELSFAAECDEFETESLTLSVVSIEKE